MLAKRHGRSHNSLRFLSATPGSRLSPKQALRTLSSIHRYGWWVIMKPTQNNQSLVGFGRLGCVVLDRISGSLIQNMLSPLL